MKTHWEKRVGRTTHYVHVTPEEVVVGSHAGSGHTDNAGSCSHADFRAGRYQDLVAKDLGPDVLGEVLAAVEAAPTWEPFVKRRAQADQRRAFVFDIPPAPALEALLADPDRERGGYNYGVRGTYDAELEAGRLLFHVDTSAVTDVRGTITHNDSGARFDFSLPGYCTAVVARDDRFFLVSAGNFFVIGSRGEQLWSTWPLRGSDSRQLVGETLRAQTVVRSGECVLVLFVWVGVNEKRSWLQFDPQRMRFTARHTP